MIVDLRWILYSEPPQGKWERGSYSAPLLPTVIEMYWLRQLPFLYLADNPGTLGESCIADVMPRHLREIYS